MAKNNSDLCSRGQYFYIVFYGQYDELERALDRCQHYAFILHNQDDEDDHYHILARYVYQRTVSAVLKDFVSYSNCFVEVLKDIQGSFDYLTHSNQPDKYQYSQDRIVFDNLDYWITNTQNSLTKKQDEMFDFVDDLVKYARKQISSREMAVKYGRDFIRNRFAYEDFGLLIVSEERDKNLC